MRFFLVLLILLIPLPAAAQQILQIYNKELPGFDHVSQAEFEAATDLYKEVPFDDEALGYAVRLPKGWTMAGDEQGLAHYTMNAKVFGEIARYYGPPMILGDRSLFTIHVLELEHDLTAMQWFVQYLLDNSYQIQGIQEFSETKVEALYVVLEGDQTLIKRSLAMVNGGRVLLVEYSLAIEGWQDERAMQDQVIDSFALQTIVNEAVEEKEEFRFLDIARIAYPQSWEVKSQALRSIDRMDVEILNIKRFGDRSKIQPRLEGKIEIAMISAFTVESLENLIETFKTGVASKGLQLGENIPDDEGFIMNDFVDFAKLEVYNATDQKNQVVAHEFWLTIMAAGDYYYFVTLLTPARDENFGVWARNTQSYLGVVESVEPLGISEPEL